ncbi:tRNA (adenine(22)-N(1))-methyltransferase TrmK [Virgibacillus sp. C22-A2]|uniref:tRNA (Adenine(22)-N(1))-methyltransferase TrmK n=1 Tax=Virgibacillus tibetensis TaxID=3042313 RepID=A0ABU6KAF4_9BACI|nr:tRNA (adenine(22)-N(1))-methyltransferase TrmK [Virgibacillus sp. C22-A2]
MINSIKLSERLKTIASFLPKGTVFADIGSDHAYLPCFVCLQDKTAKAIAGEVNEGPFNSAKDTVATCNLTSVIEVRLGNGLQVINEKDEIKQLVIAGMGGALIRMILEEGKKKLSSVQRIIAQPNVDARSVRKWLIEHRFMITNEAIIEESGHIYEIIVADKINIINPDNEDISEKQLLFGPLLMENKPKAFYSKWKLEYEKLQHVIEQMKKAKKVNEEKIIRYEFELQLIREVIEDEENTQ